MNLQSSLAPESLLPASLSDEQFIAAMEQRRVAGANFHHRDHVRLAWAYLRNCSSSEAEEKLALCIRSFAAHNGAPHKYHHTLTVAWVRIVAAAMRLTPAIHAFEHFAAAHPCLFDTRLPWAFYSPQMLGSSSARENWTEPDLHPLP